MNDFDIVAYLPELMTWLIALGALVVAFGQRKVEAVANTNTDRALELQMQGLYVEMSRDDRAARDRLQEKHDKMVQNLAHVQVQLTSVMGERDQLRLFLETSEKLHKAELAQMTVERDDLKRQIADLKSQVDGLKNRIDDVGRIAADNAEALKKERKARLKAEQERDAAIAERDALAARVAQLEAQVKALKEKLEAAKDDDGNE